MQVKDCLNKTFSSFYKVVAEISEFQENRSHAYLELIEKDDDNKIIAKAKANIWSNTYRLLKPYFETTTGYSIEAGIKILITVSVEFHEVFGYSLNIKDIDPVYTLGDIAGKRMAIIKKLEDEGIINMNKEIDLPLVPQKIAIISSKTAAGYEDFINHLNNNVFGFKFYTKLFEAFMQGSDTDKSIIQALEKINKNIERFDLVVIIRGGGSKSDLSAFDSYEIAMNISQFPLPVITGIGHERDESITDLVACISLKTPTAVADFLIHKLREVLNYLNKTSELFFLKSNELLAEKKSEFERLKLNFRYSTQEKVEKIRNELEQKMNRIKLFSRNVIGKNRLLIQQYDSVLSQSIKFYISEKKHENDGFSLKIRNAVKTYLLKQKQLNVIYGQKAEFLNPNNILKRGYSITLHQGKPVKSIKQIKPDDVIETKLIDGKFRSIVKN